MLAIKESGLVPVVIYNEPELTRIQGVLPVIAAKMLAANQCELYPIAEGTETIDVVVPAFAAAKPAPAARPEKDPRDSIEIPEDIATLHFMKRLALGKKLDPSVASAEQADAAIAAEIERRKANKEMNDA